MVRSAVWQIQHERCDRESHTCSMRRSQVLYELSRPHHECCICHTAHRKNAVTNILYAWVDFHHKLFKISTVLDGMNI